MYYNTPYNVLNSINMRGSEMSAEFKEVRVKSAGRPRSLIYGVGINDAGYAVSRRVDGKTVSCPYYSRWAKMLERACCPYYSEIHPAYKYASVCKEWHTFSTFKAWMRIQDWRGNALDKDLIIPNNKHYSPSNCCFIPTALNNLLLSCEAKRGAYPLGVCLHKASGKYQASCSVSGKATHLGYYTTPAAASIAYKTCKAKLIREAADLHPDKRVREGLRRHADNL